MNDGVTPPAKANDFAPTHPVLETVAAAVLLLVLAAIVWMVLAAYWPASFQVASTSTEVIAMLILLSAALVLISVVALLHTRAR